jgi:hypothetical protein
VPLRANAERIIRVREQPRLVIGDPVCNNFATVAYNANLDTVLGWIGS